MLRDLLADWRAHPTLAPLLLILIAVPAVFYSTTAAMADVWISNETFTHGFLILPISLWLIWGQRERIAAVPLARDLRALIFLLPTLALWLLASAIDVAVVQQLAMVALIPLTVWLVLGLPLTLALLFPLLYLFFAVPLGQSLIPPMMELTADMTVTLVQHSGIPVFRDGLGFELPTGRWSVVEECSGVRYLIASAALGTIYAYITYRSFTKRAVFIVASLLVPIIANGLRAYGIVMIGHLSGMQYAVGADHLLYGWVFFGIVIFVMFWIGGFWADAPEGTSGSAADTITANESSAAAAGPATTGFLLGALLVLLAVNLAINTLKADAPTLAEHRALTLPVQIGAWTQIDDETGTAWAPLFANPDREVSARYTSPASAAPVTVQLAYFHTQRDGAEAVSSLNRLSDPYGGDWKLIAQRSTTSAAGPVLETELSLVGRKVLVWSAYRVGSRIVANPYAAKLAQGEQWLRGRNDGAFITLATPYGTTLEASRAVLEQAWLDLGPMIARRIDDLALRD